MSDATKIMGANGDVALGQLQQEVKRQLRGAPNAISQTAGELDGDAFVAVVSDADDLSGYLPAATPDP